MADSLTVGIGLLVIAGICIQLAVARRYRSFTRDSEEAAFEKFEKDVEWQLQHELSDAIEASKSDMRDQSPLLFSSQDQAPHIAFADNQPALGSRQDFRAYSRAELDRMPMPTAPPHLVNGFHAQFVDNYSIHDTPLYVNPKQFNRILKRRMARQVIEEYFRSQTQSEHHLPHHAERLRRPRAPDGRFLTLDEVAKGVGGANGVVLA